MVTVGILAYQGGVEEHAYMTELACRRLGASCRVVLVKRREHLEGLDAVILPGGESTTIAKLAQRTGVLTALRELVLSGLPALGTCAGAVMMAKRVRDRVVGETGQPLLAVMDIEVVRNYFGRQRDSFEVDLDLQLPTGARRFRAVFIRAPAIVRLWGRARPMARLGGVVVAAVEDHMIATSFHPELTGDTAVHELLVATARGAA